MAHGGRAINTIISVQDIRTSLAGIAQRAEDGESFLVIRNSKPAFRIVPVEDPAMVRETTTVYTTKPDPRIATPIPPDMKPVGHPLRQDPSLKGARFIGDPFSPADERDWPRESR
ncbi:MAG: hypothetical protein HQ523_08070 [Lentisphaerae bacterium]|nr:hypothetical protein [Lentisphaerota bacterium]